MDKASQSGRGQLLHQLRDLSGAEREEFVANLGNPEPEIGIQLRGDFKSYLLSSYLKEMHEEDSTDIPLYDLADRDGHPITGRWILSSHSSVSGCAL